MRLRVTQWQRGFERSIPSHVKMKILDDEIKFNMLSKSEILGSDMETRGQNWAQEDSYHS